MVLIESLAEAALIRTDFRTNGDATPMAFWKKLDRSRFVLGISSMELAEYSRGWSFSYSEDLGNYAMELSDNPPLTLQLLYKLIKAFHFYKLTRVLNYSRKCKGTESKRKKHNFCYFVRIVLLAKTNETYILNNVVVLTYGREKHNEESCKHGHAIANSVTRNYPNLKLNVKILKKFIVTDHSALYILICHL